MKRKWNLKVEEVNFQGIQRSNWRKAWKEGRDADMSEELTIDIDEPQAVGEKGISIEEQYRRATDPNNRTFRVSQKIELQSILVWRQEPLKYMEQYLFLTIRKLYLRVGLRISRK